MTTPLWMIWIDTGGTFTDCIATSPSGTISRLKILSSSLLRVKLEKVSGASIVVSLPFRPTRDYFKGFFIRMALEHRRILSYDLETHTLKLNKAFAKTADSVEIFTSEEVPVFATRLITETALHEHFPTIEMKLGSTRGTNALLERKGAKTAFIVSKGFRDLLKIGNQQRPDLFSLRILKDPPLYQVSMELDERISFNGTILRPLKKREIARIISRLNHKVDSVAVALLNSYRNPIHEIAIGTALVKAGYRYVSLSHQLSSQIKILQRAETAVTNAYLDPLIHSYIGRIKVALNTASIKVMSSAGGLLEADRFKPKDSLLSGPAGGVIGALEKAREAGTDRIITFDMGGTSTDVSRCSARPDYRFESVVGTLRIFSPSLAIETIAAGGGSICHFDGYRFLVGPESAGATPGPSCYGKGGPLTITDVNLLLGRIHPHNFSIPIQLDAAARAWDKVRERIDAKASVASSEGMLHSFVDIANEKMAEAIRKISIQKGHDPSDYSLLCFGGAGGQHACSIAGLLGMNRILIPYDAGLLSAYGIGHANAEVIREKLLLKNFTNVFDELEQHFTALHNEGVAELRNKHGVDLKLTQERLIYLRLKGQETSLEISASSINQIQSDFINHYKKVYGHYLHQREIEVESIRVIVRTASTKQETSMGESEKYHPKPFHLNNIYVGSGWRKAPVYRWEDLHPGASFQGPALIISSNSTVFLEVGWSFLMDKQRTADLRNIRVKKNVTVGVHAANLELFTNRFTAIAEEMGTLLQRTSFSVNVKERLDFSCGMLDVSGNLVVNAPHIPVHLGSLGVCVRTVMKAIDFHEGDVVITNHPAFGGSHLPDISLIKPVYYKKNLCAFVVNRAHHAEIGGRKPGSMPADASCLEEEGVVISPRYLVHRGVPQWEAIDALFRSGKYPSRSPDENLADLNAGLAALMLGEEALIRLCDNYGRSVVGFYMKTLRNYAASLMKNKLPQLSKKYHGAERLDDGSMLKVNILNQRQKLIIDFSGSSSIHHGNLNATLAIVNSVTLYVLRLLIDESVPLNEGLLKPIKLVIPQGLLNPKFSSDDRLSPAVVGGNTEVSQRLTDTLLKAFGLAACSQGTMNNLLFGNKKFGYYETICGGVGAGPGFAGAHAVHQHMTNTRITDPEILEARYPVILEEFSIRNNSGGNGRWKGGNGIVRQFHFNEELDVNILSQHRVVAPYGMKGGHSGKTGEQYLIRENKKIVLSGIDGFNVLPGDRLVIKSPGGGGWGKPLSG